MRYDTIPSGGASQRAKSLFFFSSHLPSVYHYQSSTAICQVPIYLVLLTFIVFFFLFFSLSTPFLPSLSWSHFFPCPCISSSQTPWSFGQKGNRELEIGRGNNNNNRISFILFMLAQNWVFLCLDSGSRYSNNRSVIHGDTMQGMQLPVRSRQPPSTNRSIPAQ